MFTRGVQHPVASASCTHSRQYQKLGSSSPPLLIQVVVEQFLPQPKLTGAMFSFVSQVCLDSKWFIVLTALAYLIPFIANVQGSLALNLVKTTSLTSTTSHRIPGVPSRPLRTLLMAIQAHGRCVVSSGSAIQNGPPQSLCYTMASNLHQQTAMLPRAPSGTMSGSSRQARKQAVMAD